MRWGEVCVIYDDRDPPPAAIEAIIGAARFSDIIRHRTRLIDIVQAQVANGRAALHRHITSRQDVSLLIEEMPTVPGARIYLRLPSCLFPRRPDALADVVAKACFAEGSTFLSEIFSDEAPTLLTRDDAIAVLTAVSSDARRSTLALLRGGAPCMRDFCSFIDLRDTSEFLHFMSGATELRHFNRANVSNGVFRKSSADKEKMRAEHAFFHVAPENMKRFFLPTFAFEETGNGAGYAMEHLLVPDAALQLIHGAFDAESFASLLDQFFLYIHSRPKHRRGIEAVRRWSMDEIWAKVERRIEGLLESATGKRLDAALAASGPMGGLNEMLERARPIVHAKIASDRTDHLVFSHGDSCLSNILFDRRTSLFRLVDPKGAVQPEDGLRHPIYDIAKLSHCILGGYDFINNDLFRVDVNAKLELELELMRASFLNSIQRQFLERCRAEEVDLPLLRATELTLFLSMLPLHVDRPRKLIAFALTACNILRELE
jgi:hypothetical protein